MCPRPPPVCVGGGIHTGIHAGANFSVCGGVYVAVAPGLRYMFVGTGGRVAHVGGELHAVFATVAVVAPP